MLLLQSRFVDSYYVVNTLLVLCYVPLTLYFWLLTPDGSDYGRVQSLHEFGTWEKNAATSFCLVLAVQFYRRRSWDHYAQSIFFYGKLITAVTMYMVDSRLLAWYALLCWVAAATCPQPMIKLFTAESKDVYGLDPIRMKELVLANTDIIWVVFFYSEQHKESTAFAPAFYEIAKEYGGPKLKFGCLDATLWPQYCRDSLKVIPGTWTAHMPTTVLYMRGKEAGRLPRAEDVDEIGLKRNTYKKADVIQKLGLEKHR